MSKLQKKKKHWSIEIKYTINFSFRAVPLLFLLFPETIASDVDENLDKKAYKEDKTSLNQKKNKINIPFITK